MGRKSKKGGGIVNIYISDSYCDTAETKQTCKVVILQIKTFFKILELKFFRRKAEV